MSYYINVVIISQEFYNFHSIQDISDKITGGDKMFTQSKSIGDVVKGTYLPKVEGKYVFKRKEKPSPKYDTVPEIAKYRPEAKVKTFRI